MDLKLTDPVESIPLIGQKSKDRLSRLGIHTVGDLLHHYPFRFEDFSKVKKIKDLRADELVTVQGCLNSISHFRASRQFLTRARLTDESGTVDLIWFNQPFLAKTLQNQMTIRVAGKVKLWKGKLVFLAPKYEMDEPFNRRTGQIVPIYPETAGLESHWLRKRILEMLKALKKVAEPLTETIRKEFQLISLNEALRAIHSPKNWIQIQAAQRRLAVAEIMPMMLLGMRRRQEIRKRRSAVKLDPDQTQKILESFLEKLPFHLTISQKKALGEILSDLYRDYPMNRLLQGEVGSGKTVVALAVALAVIRAGGRVALLAPTEVLAGQHHQTFKNLLANQFKLEISLITGSNRSDPGKSQLVIGTQALLFRQPKNHDFSLIIIDEQHKFGVHQRSQLTSLSKKSARFPHLLTMTATPIPRTLVLTCFGDLDLSILAGKPENRQSVKTWCVPENKRQPAYEWLQQQIRENQAQILVVCPLIAESETLGSVKGAQEEYERIRQIFPEDQVGLIHGRLSAAVKTAVLEKFKQGKLQLLVATPLVEVGLDIPNLTIVAIEGAERFGLASLHQLRGRVGRSEKKSYCLIFSQSQDTATINRLKNLERIDSGLELAQLDLRQRGSGEVFGTLQSGRLNFKIADLSDINLINKTNHLCLRLLESLDENSLNQLIGEKDPERGKIELN